MRRRFKTRSLASLYKPTTTKEGFKRISFNRSSSTKNFTKANEVKFNEKSFLVGETKSGYVVVEGSSYEDFYKEEGVEVLKNDLVVGGVTFSTSLDKETTLKVVDAFFNNK